MKTIKLVFAFIVMILILSCHKESEVKTTIINGKIIDSLDNSPIKGVNIKLSKEVVLSQIPSEIENYKATSDSLGVFVLKFDQKDDFLSTTSYYISVSKTGYTDVASTIFHKIELWKSQDIKIKMIKSN